MEGGGFPAPNSSPLVPTLTDGQQRGTLFSCQSAFPASLSRSVTDEPRNSKNVLRDARRVPQMSIGFPLSGPVLRLEPALHAPPDVPLRLTEVAAWSAMRTPKPRLVVGTLRGGRIPGWAWTKLSLVYSVQGLA